MQRFTDEYIEFIRNLAEEYANDVKNIGSVILVALDIEYETIYTIIDLPEYDGLSREEWINGGTSDRELVYSCNLDHFFSKLNMRLYNINDFSPDNDWILYHISPESEIIYARTR